LQEIERHYRAIEVAKLLSVTRQAVSYWVRQGLVCAVRITGFTVLEIYEMNRQKYYHRKPATASRSAQVVRHV